MLKLLEELQQSGVSLETMLTLISIDFYNVLEDMNSRDKTFLDLVEFIKVEAPDLGKYEMEEFANLVNEKLN